MLLATGRPEEPQLPGRRDNAVHLLGDGFGLLEHGRELIVGKITIIGRSSVLAEVRHVYMAGLDGHELPDHVASSVPHGQAELLGRDPLPRQLVQYGRNSAGTALLLLDGEFECPP